ncbi:DUF1016 N-terminal domain-containing protein [Streptomyces sp. NPDC006261]|uniref:DUF1016 N-terminal domain-containing protein n=1 Tax=Streptomyces sp. NPDC006261 TaxID=3156739 RepID=UPI0033B29300
MASGSLCALENELAATPQVPGQQQAPPAELPAGLLDMADDLKTIVRGAHVRAQLKVNTEMLRMYWEIGKVILERQRGEKRGTKVIERIATELRTRFPQQREIQPIQPPLHAADGPDLAGLNRATDCCAAASRGRGRREQLRRQPAR